MVVVVSPVQTRAALYLVCIARAGYVDGARLIEFIEDWRRCVEHYGREVSVAEYTAWTRRYHQRRTVERRLRSFRATFPQLGEQGKPTQLMSPLLERLADEASR
jgi:hypothetical protein